MSSSKILKIVAIVVVIILVGWFVNSKGLLYSPQKIKVIGVMHYIKSVEAVDNGFYKGMESLGYVEGKNVHYIITPYGTAEEMKGIAQGLVNQNVDLIMAVTNVSALGAKQATEESKRTDIPIVFTHAASPDKTGLITSFKSSGNNLTGVAVDLAEVTAKKLEFFKQINPSAKRIGFLDAEHKDIGVNSVLPTLFNAAKKFGMEVVPYNVKGIGDPATAEVAVIAKNIKPGEIDAFFYLPGPVSFPPQNSILIIEMAKRLKIPVAFVLESQVQQGGLFTYADNLEEMGKETAVFADKIFHAQSPSDIPVEINAKRVLTLNLKGARESGITFPDSMLSIAQVKIDK